MADLLSRGTIQKIKGDSADGAELHVQVWGLKEVRKSGALRFSCTAGDGQDEMRSMLAGDVAQMAASGDIKDNAILKLKTFTTNEVGGEKVMVVTAVEVAGSAAPAASATVDAKPVAKAEKADPESPPYAAKPLQIRSGGSKKVQPIVSLNPYNNSWTIKAKVVNKGQMRSYKNARGEGNVFTAEIIDDQGTAIEMTMFRDQAIRYSSLLEVGKVYYISKGSLRPANRQYSSVSNLYQMVLNEGSTVEECLEEIDVSKFEAAYNFVKIENLASRIGSRAGIDVVGVVTSVSPVGTINRKSDNMPLERRDITLVDKSLKTVTLTLWNALASAEGARLEAMDSPVVVVRSVRVTDYNGVSLSTVGRSSVYISPEGVPEAQELAAWYESSGRGASTSHAGEGLASAGRGSTGGNSRDSRKTFADIKVDDADLPSPDAKPEYPHIRGAISYIKPDQTMYYMAAPDGSNKKVIEDNGQYWCEANQKKYDSFVRRYVASAKAIDSSGECWVNLFNEQAEMLLGATADQLAEMRERNDGSYERCLKKACWAPVLFTMQTKTQEYNGERRFRVNVQRANPIDYAAESKILLQKMAA